MKNQSLWLVLVLWCISFPCFPQIEMTAKICLTGQGEGKDDIKREREYERSFCYEQKLFLDFFNPGADAVALIASYWILSSDLAVRDFKVLPNEGILFKDSSAWANNKPLFKVEYYAVCVPEIKLLAPGEHFEMAFTFIEFYPPKPQDLAKVMYRWAKFNFFYLDKTAAAHLTRKFSQSYQPLSKKQYEMPVYFRDAKTDPEGKKRHYKSYIKSARKNPLMVYDRSFVKPDPEIQKFLYEQAKPVRMDVKLKQE